MKTNKLHYFLAVLMVFHFMSCKKLGLCKDDELLLTKTDYSSNQLRIDGYYFGDVNRSSSTPYANIYYLYRNGVFHTSESANLDEAETGSIKIDVPNTFGKKIKGAWGLFRIDGNNIEIERWYSSSNGCTNTIYESGQIINENTFIINKREYRKNATVNKTETPNSTFYFRPLKEKPDSTNSFIK